MKIATVYELMKDAATPLFYAIMKFKRGLRGAVLELGNYDGMGSTLMK